MNNFYKCRGLIKFINEFKVWWYVMVKFKCLMFYNVFYVCGVLMLCIMLGNVVKWVYKFDRYFFERFGKY